MGTSEADSGSKTAWRGRLRAGLRALSQELRAAASQLICARLAERLALEDGKARTVLLFAATPTEPDLFPLMFPHHDHMRWVFPKVVGAGRLGLLEVRNGRRDLAKGAFGLMEPVGGVCVEVDPAELDFALVPGLGFGGAADGPIPSGILRLGHGGGYYDRLLPKLPRSCQVIGIGFEQQWFEKAPWPTEAHDQPLDAMLSESGWH